MRHRQRTDQRGRWASVIASFFIVAACAGQTATPVPATPAPVTAAPVTAAPATAAPATAAPATAAPATAAPITAAPITAAPVTAAPATPVPTTAASAASVPQELTVAGPTALVDLDPQGPNAVEDPTTMVAGHIFDTVVAHHGTGYQPALATAWSNTDPLTWSFTIRSGVTFTDGESLTAADIKASIERIVRINGPLAPLWSALDTVEAPNATTLVVKTKTPFGGMLTNMSLLYVVPSAHADDANFFQHPVGSGPFKVDTFSPGDRLVLVANPNYWGGAPKLTKLTFLEIPDVSSRVTALTTGEIDLTWGLPPDQLAAIQANSAMHLVTTPSYAHYFHWFNSSKPPFDQLAVRQAMWHALDLNSIITNLFPGYGSLAQDAIQPPIFGFSPQQPYTFDPNLARQMLTTAGFPNGFTTSMQWSSTCCSQISELAQAMISQWADVGVTVQPQEKEQAKWVSDLLALNWDMNVSYNVTLTGDANFTLGRLYTCAAKRTGYCNPALDSLITQAQSTIDDTARAALWAQVGKYIWDNALGIFIMDVNANYAYRTNVQGFDPNPTGNPNFYSVSISN